VGITRGTTAGHIARAAVESIALQVADLADAMRSDGGDSLAELRVDGGAAVNDALLQYQADIMQLPVVRPQVTETTALGAAYLAGMATGVWKGREAIAGHWKVDRRFEPQMSGDEAAAIRARWNDAVRRSQGWAKEE
jgi:glycerol kinase